jgi:type II secretory pathway pseudopilin PulG
MWRSSSKRRALARGFTLIEAMVSLLLLVIVLTVAMSMLFQMRAFAERQQFFMLPRQTARRAVDYLSYYVSGASDLNDYTSPRTSPNALVTYYRVGGADVQASYDNLSGGETGNAVTVPNVSTKFGDVGTDILTLIAPSNPGRYVVAPTFPALGTSVDLFFNFRVGCGVTNDDAANQAAFKAATGWDGTKSALMTLLDRTGNWIYFQIPTAGYLVDGACSDVTTYKNIHVQADTQSATLPAPPGGTAGLADPVSLVTGIQVISFRVLTDPADNVPKLQQKLGLFDPATDNPGTAFVNVMDNVEDLQVAYVYAAEPVVTAGTFWNTATQTLGGDRVPPQGGPATANGPTDISNVIAIRFSVTSRSPQLGVGAQQLTNVRDQGPLTGTGSQHFRPASENHPIRMDPFQPTHPLYDLFDHYRATSMLLLRNRTLGS